MTKDLDLIKESTALLSYLERRKLTPQEACAVMGIAVEALIRNPEVVQEFIDVLVSTKSRMQDRGDWKLNDR